MLQRSEGDNEEVRSRTISSTQCKVFYPQESHIMYLRVPDYKYLMAKAVYSSNLYMVYQLWGRGPI